MKTAIRLFALTIAAVLLLMSLNLLVSDGLSGTRQEVLLRVGAQDDMKSRSILTIYDVWSRNVLFPVYSTVALFAPETEKLMPYVLKGIDADDDGTFEQTEYGEFSKQEGLNTSVVTAYYDFNGVYFHDGVQATADDLLFSYHVMALDPFDTSLDVIKDKNNREGSNYSSSRWLWVYPAEDIWDSEIHVGFDDELTFALRFELQADYSGFGEHTLGEVRILPRHLWEDTGRLCLDATDGVCSNWRENIHSDFKRAYDDSTYNGVPAAESDAFEFSDAESWLMQDDEVIGTGPFEFGTWNPGVTVRIDKNWDYKADVLACVQEGGECSGSYYGYMHQPYIDGMLFKIYKTAQAAVFALQAGEIDIISWPVPPEFINILLDDPHIGISLSVGDRFAYLGYDMQRSPFGYPDNDPTKGDVGLWLRKAIAHLVDRERIVTTLLQDSGLPGDQLVHSGDYEWYNESVPKYDHDLDTARQILDDRYTIDGFSLGWSGGWRILPTMGSNRIEISCPQADYDPIRAQACNMIAGDMRKVGLNAWVTSPSMWWPPVFEMWVTEETRPSDIVEFYYATFHSSNAGKRNLAGFQNVTFDSLIEEAREELDVTKRVQTVKQCSGILADALPYDAIYFRANVEVYRKDRFVNWTVGRTGSIFSESFWSWIGIHPPIPIHFGLSLSSVSGMKSGDTELITATVRETYGAGIQGAEVEICLSSLDTRSSLGNLTLHGEKGICISGETDINGVLSVGYASPVAIQEVLVVYFTATARVEGAGPALAMSKTTVYSEPDFLSIRIEMIDGDIILTDGSIRMTVEVMDWQGVRVSGVAVALESYPEGLLFYPGGEILLDDGFGSIRVKAPSEVLGEELEVSFYVLVTATKDGYTSGETLTEVTVLKLDRPPGPPGSIYYWHIGLIGALLAAIVILAIYRYAAQSSADQKRRHGKR